MQCRTPTQEYFINRIYNFMLPFLHLVEILYTANLETKIIVITLHSEGDLSNTQMAFHN